MTTGIVKWWVLRSNYGAMHAEPEVQSPPEPHLDDTQDKTYCRIHLRPADRLVVVTANAAFWGFLVGAYLGGRQSAFQYLAERAHRLPTTVQGWYYYHKWKNYRVAIGAFKRGSYYAARISSVCIAYEGLEMIADYSQSEVNALSSFIAGTGTGVLASLWARLPRSSAKRAITSGALVGCAIGLTQDLAHWQQGRPPRYLKCILDQAKL
ncbi:hypothetical protein EV182_002962 [Spiromyces aspiralis]|uniref:Uncharacterized protein n=1 Tax=Spiromyces aspiralis TaxID=68401 RepID=A0ACC1HUG9_9FUNG|nr:hypothetical protein EV182_002962 [Spiromyces aspiralis]